MRIGPGDRQQRLEIEVKNLREVEEYLSWLQSTRPGSSISKSIVLELHKLTAQNLYTCAGTFRTPVFCIEVTQAHFSPAPPYQIEIRLQDLVDEYNAALRPTVDAKMRLIAQFFHGFLQIHPFCGGNGRVSRALLALLLRQEGLIGEADQVHSHMTARKARLLQALQMADDGELSPLIALIWRVCIEARIDSLVYHLRRVLSPDRLAAMSPVSQMMESADRLSMDDSDFAEAASHLFTDVQVLLSSILPEN